MTIFEKAQKERNMDAFNSTVALYSILKANSSSFRVKQVLYRADEAEALPIDFVLDVEIKVKRAVGQPYYDLFLRAIYNENTEILPEYMRESLGKTFIEYGLTPDGSYRRLYYNIKNEQIRSFLKGVNHVRIHDPYFHAGDESVGVEPNCSN
jgi:hypothetical protein